jgi:hypothetical protein
LVGSSDKTYNTITNPIPNLNQNPYMQHLGKPLTFLVLNYGNYDCKIVQGGIAGNLRKNSPNFHGSKRGKAVAPNYMNHNKSYDYSGHFII